jgi:hypothetical protein
MFRRGARVRESDGVEEVGRWVDSNGSQLPPAPPLAAGIPTGGSGGAARSSLPRGISSNKVSMRAIRFSSCFLPSEPSLSASGGGSHVTRYGNRCTYARESGKKRVNYIRHP